MTVEIYDSKPRAGSFLIAEGIGVEHKVFIRTLRDNLEEDFSVLKTRKLKSTGGRAAVEYLLDEEQTIFAISLSRNTKQVVAFKRKVAKEFVAIRDKLAQVSSRQQMDAWQAERIVGKRIRHQLTDIIKEFVEYAKEQGSENADRYYVAITKMENAQLFAVEGKYKNLREVLSTDQLMTVSAADHIMRFAIKRGMIQKKYYKEIYKDIKSSVLKFVELNGGETDVLECELNKCIK